MKPSLSSTYRPSRWPLVKRSVVCVLWIALGCILLFLNIGLFRWLGLLPLGYGIARWLVSVRPLWKHVIILNEEKLTIGNRSYDWSRFDELRLNRNEHIRTIRLTGEEGKLGVTISDIFPEFDDFARKCFLHMNRTIKPKVTESEQPASEPKA